MSTHANGKNGGFFGGLFGGRKKETEEGPGASEAVQEPAGVTDELKAIESELAGEFEDPSAAEAAPPAPVEFVPAAEAREYIAGLLDGAAESQLDPSTRFDVLSQCEAAFGKKVPDYRLPLLQSPEDIVAYFEEPAEAAIRPRDLPLFHELDHQKLPPNLTIVT